MRDSRREEGTEGGGRGKGGRGKLRDGRKDSAGNRQVRKD